MKFRIAVILIALILLPSGLMGQDSSAISMVSRIYNNWDAAVRVEVIGNYAYVSTKSTGFSIVDISDSQNPIEIEYYDTGYSVNFTLVEDRAYITDYPNLLILDISDPTHINRIGYFQSQRRIKGVAVSGELAYLAVENDGLKVVDISDLANIEEVGSLTLPEFNFYNIEVIDDLAFIAAESGLRIVDISNLNQLQEIGSFEGMQIYDVNIEGDLAYLSAGGNGLRIVNISDPEQPEELGFYNSHGASQCVTVDGDFAYLADWTGGLQIVDVSNSEEPIGVGYYMITAMGVDKTDDYLYVAGHREGLRVVDVSNPEEPTEAGYYSTIGKFYRVVANEHYTYSVDRYKLYIADVSDPEEPFEVSNIVINQEPTDVAITDEHAYITTNSGLRVFDISDVEHPREVSSFDTTSRLHKVVIHDERLYAFSVSDGVLRIVNISDPENPHLYSSVQMYAGGSFEIVDNILCLAAGNFRTIDISNPAEPQELGLCRIPAGYDTEDEITIIGEYAYVYVTYWDYPYYGSEQRVSAVIDISEPETPTLVRSYNIGIKVNDLAVNDNYIFIAAGSEGLRVIDVTDREQPDEAGFYFTPGRAWGVTAGSDGLVYVADGTNLGIYDCSEALSTPSSDFILPPSSFTLLSAYPNPFNSSTTIRFNIPEAGRVSLTVYDVMGRRVRDLTPAGWLEAGEQRVILDGQGMSTGQYIVKLNTNNNIVDQKVNLIK